MKNFLTKITSSDAFKFFKSPLRKELNWVYGLLLMYATHTALLAELNVYSFFVYMMTVFIIYKTTAIQYKTFKKEENKNGNN